MHRLLVEDNYIDEIFFIDELYCNFCVDMKSGSEEKGEFTSLPSCNKCTGLIYAMKAKNYFVVN